MHLGRVVGTVVATVKTPAHAGHRILLVQPYTYSGEADGPVFAAIDLVEAGPGTWVYYVKGREAANALPDKFNPCDRTIMGIVDSVTLEKLPASRVPGGPPEPGGEAPENGA
jgi:ethanolamine utilization protein EutN